MMVRFELDREALELIDESLTDAIDTANAILMHHRTDDRMPNTVEEYLGVVGTQQKQVDALIALQRQVEGALDGN